MTNVRNMALVVAATVALAACKQGADYRRPELSVPGDFKSAGQRGPNQLATNWWLLFEDPQLTALEEAATRYNPDLQAAMQRVIQAREAARGVRSQFFPLVAFSPSITRSRSGGSSSGGAAGRTSTAVQIPFDLSYEVDIWGRVARGYESSKAQAEAAAAAYFVVLQTLQADVAQNYFNLRLLDTQAQILAENVALYRSQLGLTRTQQRAGLAPPTEVSQVEALLHATESQHLDVLRQRADVEHALAVLTGRPPSELTIAPSPVLREPPVIPPGLPIELLRRRPDVAQAEQGLRAANAEIGAAQADFLPRVTLTGAAGFQSFDLRSALDWQSRFWSLGPSLTVPIFEGGRLNAQLRQARSRYEEQLANYRSTVLNAFREVEDALTDLHFRFDQAAAQRRAVEASREYLRLSVIQRERGGFLTPLQLIDADRTLLTNQLNEAQILNQRLVATVLLIKAMGGGWEAPEASFRADRPLTDLPEHSPSAPPREKVPPLPVIDPPATQPSGTVPGPVPATSPAMVPRGGAAPAVEPETLPRNGPRPGTTPRPRS